MWSDEFDEEQSSIKLFESLHKKVRQRALLKARSNDMLNYSEYSAARETLQVLLKMQNEGEAQLETLLKIAECDVMLSRKIKQETEKTISQNLLEYGTSGHYLRELAQQEENVGAVIRHLYACKLYAKQARENPKLIKASVYASLVIISDMFKNPEKKRNTGKLIPLVVDMVAILKDVEGASNDLQVLTTAECLNKIGYTLNDMERYQDAYTYLIEGRQLMTKHFGSLAKSYHTYAVLANNIGAIHGQQSEYEDAADYHRKAINELYAAKDISEKEKRETRQLYERLLTTVEERVPRFNKRQNQEKRVEHKSDEIREKLPEKKPRDQGSAYLKKLYKHVHKAVRGLKESRRITEDTEEAILTYLEINGVEWDSVRRMASENDGAESVILHLYTCKILALTEIPDKIVKEIETDVRLSRNIVAKIIQSGKNELAEALMLLLQQMMKELHDVKGGDPGLKARAEATSLNKLGSLYNQMSMYGNAINTFKEGRRIMEEQFGSDASNDCEYGAMASGIAEACGKLGEFQKSADFHQKAMDDIKRATDISELRKKEKIESNKKAIGSALKNIERADPEPTLLTTEQPLETTESKTKQDREKLKETSQNLHHSDDNIKHVGAGIYVDHTKPLNDDHSVYEGRFGAEVVAVRRMTSKSYKTTAKNLVELKTHPNIVDYKQWGEWESNEMVGVTAIYLAMEMFESTLAELSEEKEFTIMDRITWLEHITRGLSYIHSKGMIHGALRLENLLINREESIVKIGGFFKSRRLDWNRTHITRSSSYASRFSLVAPDDKLTPKCDIYSAGLVYYRILSFGKQLKEQKDINELDFPDAEIAKAIILRMTDSDSSVRPTADECGGSPLFWDEKKKLQFISDFFKHLSSMPSDALLMQKLDDRSVEVLGGNWRENLVIFDATSITSIPTSDEREISTNESLARAETLQTTERTTEEASSGILEAMRVISSLTLAMKDDTERKTTTSEIGAWNHFSSRFPKLLQALYKLASESEIDLS